MFDNDPETQTDDAATAKTDDALYCRRCGHLITRTRWRMGDEGCQEFTNPVGITFRVLRFREAPGVRDEGAETETDTWYPGYAWNFALCQHCRQHLGWRYVAAANPPVFFGLIESRLSPHPN